MSVSTVITRFVESLLLVEIFCRLRNRGDWGSGFALMFRYEILKTVCTTLCMLLLGLFYLSTPRKPHAATYAGAILCGVACGKR